MAMTRAMSFSVTPQQAMAHSEDFYALPEITDFQLAAVTSSPGPARFKLRLSRTIWRARVIFRLPQAAHGNPRSAVVVLPQWNAQPDSHVEACRIFNFIGMSALRLTLPYHEERRPPELERADHLVSTNVGRTIQSMRQAVLDTRAAVQLAQESGLRAHGDTGNQCRIVHRVSRFRS